MAGNLFKALTHKVNVAAKAPSVGSLFKSMLTSKFLTHPIYEDADDLFLEPSFGEFTLFNLNGVVTRFAAT